MKGIYLDHCATTPVRSEVCTVMHKYLAENFGNPSSNHFFGYKAHQGIQWAREQVADTICAKPSEIYFTSGGTESDNLAIIGVAQALQAKGKHLITSCIEHHGVLNAAKYLEQQGFQITYLPVDEFGQVQLADVQKATKAETILISIMHGNNEIGTLQPIQEISQWAREKGIVFHTDAVQTLGKVPIDVAKWDIDLLSGSAHKIYGSKGAGMLYVRENTPLTPLFYGGSQENGLRPGTENVASIVGFGKALELARVEIQSYAQKTNQLRDGFWKEIQERIPNVRQNGHPDQRVPGILNLSFQNVQGQQILSGLDKKGIAASSGSACMAKHTEPSHVLRALGLPLSQLQGSIRFSIGRENTQAELNYVIQELEILVQFLRKTQHQTE